LNIAILGNGAWGTALAELLRRRRHQIKVWGRHARSGECPHLEEAVQGAELIVLSVASHGMREVCQNIRDQLPKDVLLVSATKGIEEETHLRMSQLISTVTDHENVAVISGPTFASEVLRSAPSALVCAAPIESLAKKVQTAFNGEDFRVYTHLDVTGVELGGALKNVIAIAAGACVGMGLGDNALAALITRGLAELSRIGVALGGSPETFYGLSGVGDLILTCSSHQSRNRRLGEALGQGKSLKEGLASLNGTAEGVKTCRAVFEILKSKELEAPVIQEIYLALYEGKSVRDAVKALMNREPKAEFKSFLIPIPVKK
jgi:glycerol-3-phosphate dehydrogenase (NAD(P)+)